MSVFYLFAGNGVLLAIGLEAGVVGLKATAFVADEIGATDLVGGAESTATAVESIIALSFTEVDDLGTS